MKISCASLNKRVVKERVGNGKSQKKKRKAKKAIDNQNLKGEKVKIENKIFADSLHLMLTVPQLGS